MCGRVSLTHNIEEIYRRFKVDIRGDSEVEEFTPRYNVFPSSHIPCVIQAQKGRGLAFMRWGLVPSWADDVSIGNKMINARAETIALKPSFRSAYRKRRCIIPVSGYYEWKKLDDGSRKQPYYFKMSDDDILPLAGLWEAKTMNEQNTLYTCTIITTKADKPFSSVHHRMPLVISDDNENVWLDRWVSVDTLESILRSSDTHNLEYYPVSSLCNSPVYDNRECIERVED